MNHNLELPCSEVSIYVERLARVLQSRSVSAGRFVCCSTQFVGRHEWESVSALLARKSYCPEIPPRLVPIGIGIQVSHLLILSSANFIKDEFDIAE